MSDRMSAREAAEYLGIHEKKVYYLAKTGSIPCTKVTGKWIFPKKFIDQWIEESARGPMRKSTEKERTIPAGCGQRRPET